jgi:cysteine dioxygenase
MLELLARCRQVAALPAPSLDALREALATPTDGTGLAELLHPDPERPYGRRVLLDGPHAEMMLATWTRGRPCAPHDHGGSIGAVRVVRGRARHRVHRVHDGALRTLHEETLEAGTVLTCGPTLVHSMADDGAEDGLVTLHLYVGPIPHMTVFDLEAGRTLQVSGDCGAWVPGPEGILAARDGLGAPPARSP